MNETLKLNSGPLMSVHIPKTAGTTFRHLLCDKYGSTMLVDYNDGYRAPLNPLQLTSEVACVHGHFSPAKYLNVISNGIWIVWLRDPIQRLISSYYQYLHHPNLNDSTYIKLFKSGLETDLVSFLFSDDFRNSQRCFLTPLKIEDFDFVGVCEYFDDSVKLLNTKLGLDLCLPDEFSNVNPDKSEFVYRIDPLLRRKLEDFHAEDYLIYRKALLSIRSI